MSASRPEERVLICAPLGADAATMAALLQGEGLSSRICSDLAQCVEEIPAGAGALLLAEEAFEPDGIPLLLKALKDQPPWSELPIIVLTQGGESRIHGLLELAVSAAAAVSLLERPMSSATLLRSVQVALRFRRRHYQLRDLLAEQQRQQQVLRASEHFKESLLNSLPAEIVALDGQGCIIAVNEPWQRFARENSPGNLRGLSVGANYLEVCRRASASGDTLAGEALEGIQAVLQGREPRFALEYPCHAPTRQRWFLMNVRPLEHTPGVLISHLDISDRILAQQALHDSRERLRLAAQAAHLFAFDWDAAHDVVRRDGAAAAILGVPSNEEPAAAFFARIHPEDRARFQEVLGALRAEAPAYTTTYRALRPDGTEVVLEESARGSFDEHGRLTRLIGMAADITQRKRAEDQLRESEWRYRQLIETAEEGVWVIDAAGRTTFANAKMADILGYPLEEMQGRPLFDFMDAEARHEAEQNIARRQQGIREQHEFRFRRKDRAEVCVLIATNPLLDAKGNYAGSLAVVTDITERKRAEQALRESEEQFRAMFNVASFGKAQTDPVTGRFLRVNSAMCRLTGYTEAELLSRTSRDLTHPEDRDNDWAIFTRMATGAAPDYENEKRLVTRDGGVIWVHASANLIRDAQGRPLRVAAILHDITESKRAREALRVSEERLTLATEATGYGTFDFFPQTGELIWSAHTKRQFGLGPEARIDYKVFLAGLHPEDRERIDRGVQETLRPENGGVYQTEYRTIGIEDRKERWIQARGRVFFDEAGQPLRFIGATVDITQQKAFQTELERLVAERTARLQELVGELEHFSYTITHDMRAPLRSMQGYADLVLELCSGCQKPEQAMLLKRIAASAQRMDLLITDALSYSKAVRQDIPLGPVDVSALVQGMLETYPEFQAARASITLQQDIPVVFGNQAALTQCFSNLIGNALKFVAPDRPPRVSIRAESLAVRPEDLSKYGWVRIWVEDNGVGISEVMQPRIFNMFSRGSHQFEGTGIGLALVRKVVDRMGGRVGVESQLGKGSRFWIELHAYAAGHAPPPIYPKPGPGAGSIL